MTSRPAAESEDSLLVWLRERLHRLGFDRIGDDGAVLPAGGASVVTMDHQIAGVHFPEGLDPALVARRLLEVNLSDLAAMGAEPRYALAAVSAPRTGDLRRFLSALLSASRRRGIELAGGDLASREHLAAVLTLIGRRPPGGRWLPRSGARPGDALWIGGPVGLAALGRLLVSRGAMLEGRRVVLPPGLPISDRQHGLAKQAVRAHLAPVAQLDLGQWLGRRRRAAAIDVSDGLAIDLHRLCRESRVGAELWLHDLAIVPGFEDLCRRLEADPQGLVLGGGEDYVLLFAASPRVRPPATFGCRRVGRLVAQRRLRLIDAEGSRPLSASGWDHFRRSPREGVDCASRASRA